MVFGGQRLISLLPPEAQCLVLCDLCIVEVCQLLTHLAVPNVASVAGARSMEECFASWRDFKSNRGMLAHLA